MKYVMEMNSEKYEQHSFKSFLSKYHVVIPMVQRDYAQGRETGDVNRVRNRFLTAIKDHLTGNKTMTMDFVYGECDSKVLGKLDSIIVTPLDGQQRLTTLYLLHWYAAKKAGLQPADYAFLKNFTYEIRPSSRDFCCHLLDFTPSSDSLLKLKEQLIDQYWFMGDWHNDPTILGMLVMLDAIKEKFDSVENLWQLLTEDKRIIFFFLPLSENGLSDKLYIKMNSRGKKLTPFEHFKAEYEALYERDSKASRDINHKFDVEWADALFDYRDDKDDTTDKEFMRYFFYISHILCYEQSIPSSADEFELIRTLYKESPKAVQNRQFLESALDCWYEVKKNSQFCSIDDFFSHYLSQSTHEKGKVATYKDEGEMSEYRKTQNFFRACIKLYQASHQFSYGDFLFLYGIILYLTHQEKISETAFIERLRILRNLIWNSNAGEIRQDTDYMHDLLAAVSQLMLNGVIKTNGKHGFNKIQEDEEIEKQVRKAEMTPDDLERMYKYEDHPLIYGHVSGLGYDHLHLTDAFYSVFSPNCDYKKIHLALIAVGDYRQKAGSRYSMANHNRSTWTQMLHKSRSREGFEDSMEVVRELLQRVQDGESIEGVKESFIEEQEQKSEYTWRYYFAKYSDMLRGADGELVWDDSNDYICTTLNKHQFNGQHWNSFLNVIYQLLAEDLGDVLRLENYGGNLLLSSPMASIGPLSNGFQYFHGETKDEWIVNQNGGVDTEDRILMAIEKIEAVVKEARGNDATSSTDDNGINN